jgi:hypothetical protein
MLRFKKHKCHCQYMMNSIRFRLTTYMIFETATWYLANEAPKLHSKEKEGV